MLRTNTCRVKNSYYAFKKVVRVTCNIEYATSVRVESSLIKSSSIVNPIFVVIKYSKSISCKFKVIKFIT